MNVQPLALSPIITGYLLASVVAMKLSAQDGQELLVPGPAFKAQAACAPLDTKCDGAGSAGVALREYVGEDLG